MQLTIYELLLILGVPAIFTFLFQMLYMYIVNKHKNNKKSDKNLAKGLQVLLRDRLREHYIIHTKKGYVELADKDLYVSMYDVYHDLGTNGVMEDMYYQILELPTTKPKPKPKKPTNKAAFTAKEIK